MNILELCMKEILFTAKARGLLRSAGWFPGRDVPISIADSDGELLPSAVKVLCEFGNLSIHTGTHQRLMFGPRFDSVNETSLAERIISATDLAAEKAVWEYVSQQIGIPVSSVAWEEGQDLDALAVSEDGSVYCATWRYDEPTQIINVDLIKLADSIAAYLNFWLDPTEATRSELHLMFPSWEQDVELSYIPEGQP